LTPPTPPRRRVITRICGCPHCLKWNKVPADLYRYRCGHCGKPIDGTPPTHPDYRKE
jgi:hypothetical protein